ncbi:signal transduction histidine kinase [Ancylomarina subtilis]|uniref:histidine kinase n=1 Tax=Ancylomarina subtilis TaxID=1639035 RepID=A0A4Q7VCK7_9BACT|nr:response regulator [Ancylomarina subtilis]RZT93400.1 signal transduction histidine kinase [Ancylomarina subtilis]
MNLPISKFRDWKIKSRLFLLTVVSIISIILLGFLANFFFQSSRVLTLFMNADRIHNNTFNNGLQDYYKYIALNDKTYYISSLKKIKEANTMAYTFSSIDEHIQNLSRKDFIALFYSAFPSSHHPEEKIVNILYDRLKLLNKINPQRLKENQAIAKYGYNLGMHIQKHIENHKDGEINFELLNDINELKTHFGDFAKETEQISNNVNTALIYIIGFFILFIAIFISSISYIINRSISKPAAILAKSFKLLNKGIPQKKLNYKSNSELGILTQSFNEIQFGFTRIIHNIQKVSEGDYTAKLKPRSKQDEFTHTFNRIVDQLKASHIKNEETNWFRTGLNQLNKKLRGDQEISEVANNALQFTIKFLNAELGALYIYDEGDEVFNLKAAYGLPDKNQFKFIKKGHGLVGSITDSTEIKHIKDLPKDYFTIFSGTGEISPKEILLIPLVFNNHLWGVMELASIQEFTLQKIKFLETANETITVNIASSIARERLENLLRTTQDQANELQVQQEELRVANEELEEHTKILTENEKRLQVQQEELRVANEELEERSNQLELQKNEIEKQNQNLSQTHDELELKAKELEQASQYKSDFLANMSHELRTPLNSLLILSGMLAKNKKGNLTQSDIESAEIIHKSGKDLLQLINEVLDLSKIEAGKMTVEFAPTNAEEIKQEIMLDFKHQAEKKKLALSVEIDKNIPKTFISDKQRLSQIIKNLLSNAIKFTTKGSITVSFDKLDDKTALMRTDLDPSQALSISITDTGVGIPDDKKEAIFEAFQQADGSTSRKYGGTGLGLSISKELAYMLGGEIHLESKIDQGSTFTIIIPEKPNHESEIKHEVIRKMPPAENEKPKDVEIELSVPTQFIDDDRYSDSNKALVLLIHPEKEKAKKLLHLINQNDFKAVAAADIKSAIALAETYQPSSVIISSILLLTDGEEKLELLKNNPLTSNLPLHVVSPVDGLKEDEKDQLTTVNAVDFDSAMNEINKQLFSNSKHILIVEDNANTRQVINLLLQQNDVQIDEAVSGTEALTKIKSKQYDCIILDLGLPDFSGHELLKKLTALNIRIPNTIIYTGKELSREKHRELSKYTNSIILKGLKSDERLMDEVSLFLHHVSIKNPQSQSLHNGTLDESIFKGKKILVVDDEIRNIFALGKILEDKDMEVLEAENGKIALEVLKENNNIDLILMDVMMPEMDGYTAIEHIRKTPKIKDIPVICTTAKAMKEDYDKAIAHGANDYLSKPIDENKLFSMLKIWLYN